jgi:type I restriction enzyme, S subunit
MGLLEQHFDVAFAAPDGIKKLRELILTLAMQGKLVPQDPNDEPASELLRSIEAEKQDLVDKGEIKQPKTLQKIKVQEVPYKLPNGWEWIRLSNVSTKIHYGYNASANHSLKNIRLLRITDIQNNQVNWESVPGCEDRGKDIGQYLLKNRDILIARTGGTVGKSYLVEKINVDAVFASYLIRVVPVSDIDVEYIKYYLESPLYWKQLYEKCTGTGQPNVNGTSLSSLLLSLPPLAEQRRIVAKIDRLMARCDELEKLRLDRSQRLLTVHTAALDRLLTAKDSSEFSTAWSFITQHFGELYSVKENVVELREAILELAVMGKLSKVQQTDKTISSLLEKIKLEKEQLGMTIKEREIFEQDYQIAITGISNNRVYLKARFFCGFITKGTTPANTELITEGDIPFLKVYNIVNNKINFDYKPIFIASDVHNKKLKRSIVYPGDVIMNIVGPPLRKVAIVPDSYSEWNMNQALAVFRPLARIDSKYIYFMLSSKSILESVLSEVKGTAGQDNLSLEQCRDLLIPIPSIEEQRRIVEKIDRLMGMCDRLEESILSGKGKQTDLLNALMSQV